MIKPKLVQKTNNEGGSKTSWIVKEFLNSQEFSLVLFTHGSVHSVRPRRMDSSFTVVLLEVSSFFPMSFVGVGGQETPMDIYVIINCEVHRSDCCCDFGLYKTNLMNLMKLEWMWAWTGLNLVETETRWKDWGHKWPEENGSKLQSDLKPALLLFLKWKVRALTKMIFCFRLVATRGIKVTRRDFLKVNVPKTWWGTQLKSTAGQDWIRPALNLCKELDQDWVKSSELD